MGVLVPIAVFGWCASLIFVIGVSLWRLRRYSPDEERFRIEAERHADGLDPKHGWWRVVLLIGYGYAVVGGLWLVVLFIIQILVLVLR
jgi:hypothetical protein